jgi:hypothetical protein
MRRKPWLIVALIPVVAVGAYVVRRSLQPVVQFSDGLEGRMQLKGGPHAEENARNLWRALTVLAQAQDAQREASSPSAPVPAAAQPTSPMPPAVAEKIVADLMESARLSDEEGIRVKLVLETAGRIAAGIETDKDAARRTERYRRLGEHVRQALLNVVPHAKEENVQAYFARASYFDEPKTRPATVTR